MFLFRIHLAKSLVIAMRREYRIISESPLSSGRPGYGSGNPAFKTFCVAIWPGQRQGTDKGTASVWITAQKQGFADPAHRLGKIFVGPAQRAE